MAGSYDRYVDLTGVTYSTSATLGTEGVNYLRTRYAYSNQGKVDRVQNPAGTITLYRHDGLARTVAAYVGTDDSTTDGYKWNPSNASATSNMVLVSTNEYDDGGVGNGNLTSVTQYPGVGADPRAPLLRLRPRGLHDVPYGIRRGLLLQGPRRLPILQRPPHGPDGRASCRSRHPAGARAAVGDLRAQAIAGHACRPTPSRRRTHEDFSC